MPKPRRLESPPLAEQDNVVALLWSEFQVDLTRLLHRHEARFYERMKCHVNTTGVCCPLCVSSLGSAVAATDETNNAEGNRSHRNLDALPTREPGCADCVGSPELAASPVDDNHSVDAAADREQDESRAISAHDETVTNFSGEIDALDADLCAVGKPKTSFGGLRGKLYDLTSNRYFDALVVCTIVANAVTMAASVQLSATSRKASDELSSPVIDVLELIFLTFFTVELSVRIFVRRRHFFIGHEWNWNLFDALVVGMSLLNLMLSAFLDASLPSQLSVLRLLRIVRVVRMLRILRVVKFFKDLRLMIMAILSCVKSLVWVSLILFLTYFIFAIGLTQATVDYLSKNNKWQDEEFINLREYFSSLDRSVISLFQAMLGGTSWGEYVDALSPLSWVFGFMFGVFIMFSMLAVLNIVTAVFVQYTMEAAGQAKELIALEKQEERERMFKALQRLLHRVDTDDDGKISLEELEVALHIPEIGELFEDLSIDAEDTHVLFSLLDACGDGHVDIDELLAGCLRIKHPPSNWDYACMLYHIKFLVRRLAPNEPATSQGAFAKLNADFQQKTYLDPELADS